MKIDLTAGERERIAIAIEISIKAGGHDLLCDPIKLINKMKIKRKCECCGGRGYKL